MNKYRLDYLALHDAAGKQLGARTVKLKDYVPVLNNSLANAFFLYRAKKDALALNSVNDGRISFDFLVNRAKHYGYLYTEVPAGLVQRVSFYYSFIALMIKA